MAEMAGEYATLQPLIIFYDSEAANGNVYQGDVIEIAAKCHPDVVKGSFQTLINTKQSLCAFATKECAISEEDLRNKPSFPEAIKSFLTWINDMVDRAKRRQGHQFFPVLCAHYGFQFDFLILLANMEKSGLHHSLLSRQNIHFADSLVLCKELKEKGEKLLANTKLSLDGLFKKFFPQATYYEKHRAMGDVEAMVKIFAQTGLKNLLHHMGYSTTKERVDYYVSQSTAKKQQAILEEKLCKLDACSKNMSVKKLIREGITYNSLRKLFEDSSSFLDFYEVMKAYSVERKVAKVMALHFSGMGLENQGALAYAETHRKLLTTDQANATVENMPRKRDHSETKPLQKATTSPTRQKLVEEKPQKPEAASHSTGEDWEAEANCSLAHKSFSLKFTTPAPLSLNAEDFSTCADEKKKGKDSKIGWQNATSRKPNAVRLHSPKREDSRLTKSRQKFENAQAHSDKQEASRPTKSQQKLMYEQEPNDKLEASRATRSQPNLANGQEQSDKQEARRPIKNQSQSVIEQEQSNSRATRGPMKSQPKSVNRQDQIANRHTSISNTRQVRGRVVKPPVKPLPKKQQGEGHSSPVGRKTKPVIVRKNKMESVESLERGKRLENKETSLSKENEPVSVAADGKISITTVENQAKEEDQSSTSKQSPFSLQSCTNDLRETAEKSVQVDISNAASNGFSPQEVIRKFTSVFIGDVAILVPIDDAEYDSQFEDAVTDLPTQDEDRVEEEAASDSRTGVDLFSHDLEAALEDNATQPTERMSKIRLDACPQTQETEQKELSEASDEASMDVSFVPCNFNRPWLETEEDVSGHLPLSGINKKDENMDAVEQIQPGDNGLDSELAVQNSNVTSGGGQESPSASETYLIDDQTDGLRNSEMQHQWDEMAQTHSSNEDTVLASYTAGAVANVVGVHQMLGIHAVGSAQLNGGSTIDQLVANSEPLVDSSSESSSSSEEHPIDTFFRQPPLGAERGYTPETVQPQPAWVGNSSGAYQMPPSQGIGYVQGSWPAYANVYGSFNQVPQAVPLIRPCYSSFGHPPSYPPQLAPQHQHNFLTPFQYRHPLLISNPSQASVALPPSVFASQGFRPSLLHFYAGTACYPYPPAPFYENPYDYSMASSITTYRGNTSSLSEIENTFQGNCDVGYSSLYVDPQLTLTASVEESSSDTSSTTSSDNFLDFPTSLEANRSSSWNDMSDRSPFSQESVTMQLRHDPACLVAGPVLSSGERSGMMIEDSVVLYTGSSGYGQSTQTSNLLLSPRREAYPNSTHVAIASTLPSQLHTEPKPSVSPLENRRQQTTGDVPAETVSQEVTIISLDAKTMSMGRRLSPDGSSMDKSCTDSPADVKTDDSMKQTLDTQPMSTCSTIGVSGGNCRPTAKPSEGPTLTTCSPKPQRNRDNRRRRNIEEGQTEHISELHSEEARSKQVDVLKKAVGIPGDISTLKDRSEWTQDSSGTVLIKPRKPTHRSVNLKKVKFPKEKADLESVHSSQSSEKQQKFSQKAMKDLSIPYERQLIVTNSANPPQSEKDSADAAHPVQRNNETTIGREAKCTRGESRRVSSDIRGLQGDLKRLDRAKQRPTRAPRRVEESNCWADKNNNR